MVNPTLIIPNTPVLCSNHTELALVDHMEGTDFIKLQKDDAGQHHYIPVNWVIAVGEAIQLDRPFSAAIQQWLSTLPSPIVPDFDGAKHRRDVDEPNRRT